MNREGYKDPTADRAIREADKVPERVSDLIHIIKKLVEICDCEVTGRIWLKDKKTGKEYR